VNKVYSNLKTTHDYSHYSNYSITLNIIF
jgi:hypothetical protein